MTISKIQELQLRLIESTNYNAMEGERVAADLRKHQDWWRACLLTRDHPSDLICLRDLEDNHWNADTLYILSSGANDAQLEELANSWTAEVHWLSAKEADSRMGTRNGGRVLVLWWD